tara:strand:- start:37126 stop:38157 length:1032 start_codon:yes stop_codon:yes gene_type:complete
LNHILKGDHGKRIVVIENEFGEVDIDSELVAFQDDAEEDILLLNNGCLCCTVRGDLVDMLGKLVTEKKGQFDHILIETTGLANPAPIIQTFYLEPDLLDTLRLDGVVTLVDSKYTMRHLDEEKPEGVVNEALEQVAFADRLVMNKIDLVTEAELRSVEARVRTINNLATIQRAEKAQVDLDFVLGIGGFDLDRVQDVIEPEPAHGHSHSHGEPAAEAECDVCGEHGHSHAHHVHDDAVTSVSLTMDGEVDLDKVNDWLGMLLNDRWQDLFRMKGVLAIEGCDDRYVFQGVHALFEGMPDRPWEDGEARTSRLVFIGKQLDRAELEAGFQACRVGAAAAAGASA